jgi:DNA-binding NarL/FixJ family response regulator
VTAISVLVADDHPTFVRAVTLLLNGDPDIEVVATAADGAEAIDQAMAHQPDVVLMDVNMPVIDGIEATRQIIEAAPHIAVIVLTMFDDDDNVAAAMRRGATGYLLKGARQEQIRRAVHAAHAGEAILDATIARRLKIVFADRPAEPSPRRSFPQLTEREMDVLDRLAAGLDNPSIARVLYLSEKTIRNYASGIFTKLHVDSRAEAIVLGRDAGLGRA